MFHSQHLHCYHDFLEENEMSILSTTIFDIFWCNLHKNFFEGDKPRVAGLLNRATPLLVWLMPQILNATFFLICPHCFAVLFQTAINNHDIPPVSIFTSPLTYD